MSQKINVKWYIVAATVDTKYFYKIDLSSFYCFLMKIHSYINEIHIKISDFFFQQLHFN